MSDWIGRLASIAFIAAVGALLTGWLLGPVFASLFLFAYLVAVVAIGLRARVRLAKWLAHPSPDDMPDDDGPWGEIYARLHRILREQTASRASLSHALWRFRQAGEAMPDGVLVLDADDRIEWLNPSAEDHFGLTFKRDRGQAVTNLIRSPAFVDYLAAQNYGEPLLLKGLVETDRVLSVNLVPYGNHEKLLLSRDVTRWERLESMRRDFIANVSHELRTPLTVITGYLETLEDEGDELPPVWQRSVQAMSEQANRMTHLVQDLLLLARLESDGDPASPHEPVAVPAILSGLEEELRLRSAGRHRIESSVDGRLWLAGDAQQLRGVFNNLLENALQYTPDGGQISLRWYPDEAGAHFTVRDTGIGIAPQHISRLTERFFRVDAGRSRARGGTGLGLAIVKHALSHHGAHLRIESAPGVGSSFTCDFPPARVLEPPDGDLEPGSIGEPRASAPARDS